jgi:DNA invertase Pin-like site-specific DNA recombinase
MNHKRAVPYLRVSTVEQAETMSIATQLAVIERWAAAEGYQLAPPFTDAGESAKTVDRTELKRLLAYCREHRGDVACVVVFRLDRWTRELRDFVHLGEQLAKLGVTLRSATEAFGDGEAGELHQGLAALFAQYDNRVRARRAREGMRMGVERGRWLWRAPLGYHNSRTRTGPSLLVDPVAGPLVRRGIELMATGSLSAAGILDRLTAQGLRSRKGRVLTEGTWSQTLRHPSYCGRLVIPTWGVDGAGDWEPLVSRSTWSRAQLVLDGRVLVPTKRESERPEFPLRRFCRCGLCDRSLTGSWTEGNGGRYAYYRCWQRECTRPSFAVGVLHDRFIELLSDRQPPAPALQALRAAVERRWRDLHREAGEAQAAAERLRQAALQRRDRLIDAYIDRAITEADYRTRLTALEREVQSLEAQTHPNTGNPLDELPALLEFAEQTLTRASDTWLSMGMEGRRRFQSWVFPRGVVAHPPGRLATPETCLLFSDLSGLWQGVAGMVPRAGKPRNRADIIPKLATDLSRLRGILAEAA